jgi:predicted aspartyl protease
MRQAQFLQHKQRKPMPKKPHILLAIAITTALMSVTPFSASQSPSSNQPVLIIPINRHAIIVPVAINGRNYRFLLDTGASYTMIDNALAATLTRATPESQIPFVFQQMLAAGLTTVDGKLKKDDIKLWQAKPIALGDYQIVGADPWLGHDMSLLTQSLGERIDGILGVEVFRQLSWAVDNTHKTLTIWQQAPSTLGYRQCVPYNDTHGGSPEIAIDFTNNWASFRVDTGADYTIVSGEFLKFLHDNGGQVEQTGNDAPSVSASGLGSTDSYLVDGLSFNNTAIGSLQVGQGNSGFNHIGMNFLARFEQYLFTPNKMLFCYNAASFTRNEQKPLRNIAVRYFEGRIEVSHNPPADIARYDLQNGDKLLEINGRKAVPAQIGDVRQMLMDKPVGTLKLLIERDGRQKALTL